MFATLPIIPDVAFSSGQAPRILDLDKTSTRRVLKNRMSAKEDRIVCTSQTPPLRSLNSVQEAKLCLFRASVSNVPVRQSLFRYIAYTRFPQYQAACKSRISVLFSSPCLPRTYRPAQNRRVSDPLRILASFQHMVEKIKIIFFGVYDLDFVPPAFKKRFRLVLYKSICSGNSPEMPRFLSNMTSLKTMVEGGNPCI